MEAFSCISSLIPAQKICAALLTGGRVPPAAPLGEQLTTPIPKGFFSKGLRLYLRCSMGGTSQSIASVCCSQAASASRRLAPGGVLCRSALRWATSPRQLS